MAKRQIQQPLLYIQQPKFEVHGSSMQQYYLIKNRKNKEQVKNDSIVAEENREVIEGKLVDNFNKLFIEEDGIDNLEMILDPVSSTFLVDEREEVEESGVIDFILEGILTSGENEIMSEKMKEEDNRYIRYLDFIQNQVTDTTVNSEEKTEIIELQPTFELDNTILIEEEQQTPIAFKEFTEIDKEESLILKEKLRPESQKEKKRKRTPFNQLSLSEQIYELKKMSGLGVKVLYMFKTNYNTYVGYFVSYKRGALLLQPVQSKEAIKVAEDILTEIKILGI